MSACVPADVVFCRAQPGPDGLTRWVLQDVVGLEDGLGVECLSGSGAAASAFNRTFRRVHAKHFIASVWLPQHRVQHGLLHTRPQLAAWPRRDP